MRELELSLMDHGHGFSAEVQSMLERFRSLTGVRVNLRLIPWRGSWSEMVQIALYGEGPSVSEVGSTWVGDFVGMNALRPFSVQEAAQVGGAESFLTSSWESGAVAGLTAGQAVWAVPWTADTRILNYRRDWLENAGLDPATAFKDFPAMMHTLQCLQDKSYSSPWVIPTQRSRMSIHMIASFVWGAGGRFVSEDHKRTAFADPEAKQGIYNYFTLARFLSPEAQNLSEIDANTFYWSGKAGVTISGPWLLKEEGVPQETIDSSGQVMPPGVPFVGGSHLVIWRRSPRPELAVDLVRFLSSPDVQKVMFDKYGHIPTHMEVLENAEQNGEKFLSMLSRGLREGRSLPAFTLWGLIENKLTDTFTAIWQNVLQNPQADVRPIVDDFIDPLARRLNITLSS